MLCNVCRDVIQAKKGALSDEDGTVLCVHHIRVESLQESAKDGCHICASVWEHLGTTQQKYLLELDAKDPITNMLMSGPQILESPRLMEVFGPDSLILAIQFELDKKVWDLPGGAGERTNMFLLQPSEVISDFTLSTPSGDSGELRCHVVVGQQAHLDGPAQLAEAVRLTANSALLMRGPLAEGGGSSVARSREYEARRGLKLDSTWKRALL